MDLRVLVPLKMTCTLVCKKSLDSSLRPGAYEIEKKILVLTFKPVSEFTIGVVGFFSEFLIFQSG